MSSHQGLETREGGVNRWSTGDLLSRETVLYGAVMMDIEHYMFVKIHKMFSRKHEP